MKSLMTFFSKRLLYRVHGHQRKAAKPIIFFLITVSRENSYSSTQWTFSWALSTEKKTHNLLIWFHISIPNCYGRFSFFFLLLSSLPIWNCPCTYLRKTNFGYVENEKFDDLRNVVWWNGNVGKYPFSQNSLNVYSIRREWNCHQMISTLICSIIVIINCDDSSLRMRKIIAMWNFHHHQSINEKMLSTYKCFQYVKSGRRLKTEKRQVLINCKVREEKKKKKQKKKN